MTKFYLCVVVPSLCLFHLLQNTLRFLDPRFWRTRGVVTLSFALCYVSFNYMRRIVYYK